MTQTNETLPAVEKKGNVVEMAIADTSQFVTFYYDKHFFGLPIDDVIEINRTLDVTPVPMAPKYVSGVVNLRGQILTAIDLATRIGLLCKKQDQEDGKEYNNVIMGNREEPISLLVERIGDVMSIPTDKIEPPPDMIEGIDLKYVGQVCKLDNKLLIILNSKAIECTENKKQNG